jgi:hypothetical protein
MKTAIVGIVALSLAGCSVIFPKAGPQLAKAVNQYCATLSQDERALLRQQVNDAIKPNQACVYCEGDGAARCLTTQ